MPLKRRARKHRKINIAYLPCMLEVTQLNSSTLLICVLDGSQNELGDTSGPLFSLYSKTVEEDDINSAERHQKDAEGIVLFVSPCSRLHTRKHVNRKLNPRLACSQPLSPR